MYVQPPSPCVLAPIADGATYTAGVQGPDETQEKERAGAVERALHSALLMMLRHMRAARRTDPGWLEPLVDQLFEALSSVLADHEVIHLRVGPDGFFHGPHRVAEYSPREDVAVFQLFQNGVRQLTFSQGLSREEVHALLDVLSTDLVALQAEDEDVTTLLLSKELTAISIVVIETFSEVGQAEDDPRGNSRAAVVATLVADALRNTISDVGEDSGGGGSIRFGQADVKFLQETDVAKLLASLGRGGGSEDGAGRALDDPEIAKLGEELGKSFDQSGLALARAALAAIDGAEQPVAERLSGLLASEVLREAKRNGISIAASMLAEIVTWIEARPRGAIGQKVAADAWSSELVSLAVKAAAGEPGPDRDVGLTLLAALPADQATGALRQIARLPAGMQRTDAIGVLMSGGQALAAAIALLASLDADAQLAMLRAMRASAADPDTLTLFRAALSASDFGVRVQALAWFTHHGGDHAIGTLGSALRDTDGRMRAAALLLTARSRVRGARSVLKVWFDEPAFDELPLDEKRTGALILAQLAGSVVRESMRELAFQSNLMKRPKVDERRAVAVAALGLLADTESLDALRKLTESRTSGQALRQEAAIVIPALTAGRAPYDDQVAALDTQLRATDIGPSLDADQPSLPVVAPLRRAATTDPTGLRGTAGSQAPAATRLSGAFVRRSAPAPTERSSAMPTPAPLRAQERGSADSGARAPTAGLATLDPAELLEGYSFDDLTPLARRAWGGRR